MGRRLAKYHTKDPFEERKKQQNSRHETVRTCLPPVDKVTTVTRKKTTFLTNLKRERGIMGDVLVKTDGLSPESSSKETIRSKGAMLIKKVFPDAGYRFALFKKGKRARFRGGRVVEDPFLMTSVVGPDLEHVIKKIKHREEAEELAEEYALTQSKGLKEGVLWAYSSSNFALSEDGRIIPCDEEDVKETDANHIKAGINGMRGHIKRLKEDKVREYIEDSTYRSGKKIALLNSLRFFRGLPPDLLKKACLAYLDSLERHLSRPV
jgi:hypothetical protein